MNYLVSAIGRKALLGVFVFAIMTAMYYLRGEQASFGRYADFAEMAFGIFVLGNAMEHFAKNKK